MLGVGRGEGGKGDPGAFKGRLRGDRGSAPPWPSGHGRGWGLDARGAALLLPQTRRALPRLGCSLRLSLAYLVSFVLGLFTIEHVDSGAFVRPVWVGVSRARAARVRARAGLALGRCQRGRAAGRSFGLRAPRRLSRRARSCGVASGGSGFGHRAQEQLRVGDGVDVGVGVGVGRVVVRGSLECGGWRHGGGGRVS